MERDTIDQFELETSEKSIETNDWMSDTMEKIPDDIKGKIWANFDESREIYFATIDGDQPKVRPVTLVPLDSRFWVLTGTDDAKTKQIKENPKIEICLPLKKGENSGYVRFCGLAKIVTDRKTKEKIAASVDYFANYWKSPEDPTYTLIETEFVEIEYLEPGKSLADKYYL